MMRIEYSTWQRVLQQEREGNERLREREGQTKEKKKQNSELKREMCREKSVGE